jgi:sarcosine oxidase
MLITVHSAASTVETAAIVRTNLAQYDIGGHSRRHASRSGSTAGVALVSGGGGLSPVTSPSLARPTGRFHYPVRSAAMERFDVIIVGGGPMGAAAARALSARGRAVVLLERFTLGNDRGSTAGTTRNFRLTYHDPLYVRMARRALERWRELEDEAGRELLRVVGGLDVGEATEASARALEDAGERFERPPGAEVAERWPMLRFPPGSSFVYQPDGAVIRSQVAVRTLAELAVGHGADVREETRAESIGVTAEAVQVVTAGGAMQAPVAIVAAGAWTGPLLEPAGIDLALHPTLEQTTYFDTEARDLPTVIDWDETPDEPPYIVPDPFAPGRIKAGAHLSGPAVDPEERSFEADEPRERRVVDWVGRRLLSPCTALRTETCLYTRTRDEDFVLDRVGPIVVASPCSGHGFKFAPLIGEVLADLAAGESAEISLERFRADRPAVRP